MSTRQKKPIATQRFDARNLQQNSVTVFTDGAEVRRLFDVKLESGLTDVIVDNLAWEIDFGTVQFDVDHTATIEAVQFKEEHATWAELDSPQVTEVVQQQQDLQRELASKKAQKTFYEKSLNNKMEKLLLATELDKNSELDNDDYYKKHFSHIQALILSTDAELEELEAQNRKYEEQVEEIRPRKAKKKCVVVTLSSSVMAEVKLVLTYRVGNACWSPCYVVHMTTERDKATPPETTDSVAPTKAHMKLHYMADIRQNTGETWNAEKLVLSTAQVHQVKPLTKLGTLKTKFRRQVRAGDIDIDESDEDYGQMPHADCMEMPRFAGLEAKCGRRVMHAEKQSLSTTFEVSAPKPIASDSSEHKLTIAYHSFETQIRLECVPSKSTEVVQTASALNDSDYPLLAGRASVYVDNNFASETRLTAVPVGDRIVCTLGVDSDIKVEYKPADTVRKSSSDKKTAISDHVQKIFVNNLKPDAVLITVHEQVPKSTDDQIKVNLLSPIVKEDEDTSGDQNTLDSGGIGARLNADHNLEWAVLLNAGEQRELVVKWSLESPAKKTVKYVGDYN